MKRLILAAYLLMLPSTASAFEFLFPYQSQKPDHVKIALTYDGYSAKVNRRELKELMDIDPVIIPWCAGFLNAILSKAGLQTTDSLLASSFQSYGKKVKEPKVGDIVVITRRGGSGRHVGIFYGFEYEEGQKYVRILGGNQNKGVQVSSYHISRVVMYRRPG